MMTKFPKKRILFSKYNNLSEIYDMKTKIKVKDIPSANYYYNSNKKVIERIINIKDTGPILSKNYSILGIKNNNNNNNNNNNKATLIKFKSGIIALKIPYLKLIKLYRERR